jgi:hypothetical protein
VIKIAKKRKKRANRKPVRHKVKPKKKKQILAINHDSKRINNQTYYSNVGYKSKSRALKEAKKIRKQGKYRATVKPYTSHTLKGKKSKWSAVYTKRK